MAGTTENDPAQRVLDANLNRLKEGIRVIEDTARYLCDDKDLASRLKALRHGACLNLPLKLLSSRDSSSDVLKKTIPLETKREDVFQIVQANFKRAQEACRVLEEYLKCDGLKEFGESENFKNVRYELYALQKEFTLKRFGSF